MPKAEGQPSVSAPPCSSPASDAAPGDAPSLSRGGPEGSWMSDGLRDASLFGFTQPLAPLGSGLVGEVRVAAAGRRSDPTRKSEKQGEQEKAWMKQRDLPENLWGDSGQILREKLLLLSSRIGRENQRKHQGEKSTNFCKCTWTKQQKQRGTFMWRPGLCSYDCSYAGLWSIVAAAWVPIQAIAR